MFNNPSKLKIISVLRYKVEESFSSLFLHNNPESDHPQNRMEWCKKKIFLFSNHLPWPEGTLHTCLTPSGSLQHSVWINNSSRIVQSDYVTSNGVIHHVDKLLTPYTLQNVASHQSDKVCGEVIKCGVSSSNVLHRRWLYSCFCTHVDEPHRSNAVLRLHSLLQDGGGKTGTRLPAVTLSLCKHRRIKTTDLWPILCW